MSAGVGPRAGWQNSIVKEPKMRRPSDVRQATGHAYMCTREFYRLGARKAIAKFKISADAQVLAPLEDSELSEPWIWRANVSWLLSRCRLSRRGADVEKVSGAFLRCEQWWLAASRSRERGRRCASAGNRSVQLSERVGYSMPLSSRAALVFDEPARDGDRFARRGTGS